MSNLRSLIENSLSSENATRRQSEAALQDLLQRNARQVAMQLCELVCDRNAPQGARQLAALTIKQASTKESWRKQQHDGDDGLGERILSHLIEALLTEEHSIGKIVAIAISAIICGDGTEKFSGGIRTICIGIVQATQTFPFPPALDNAVRCLCYLTENLSVTQSDLILAFLHPVYLRFFGSENGGGNEDPSQQFSSSVLQQRLLASENSMEVVARTMRVFSNVLFSCTPALAEPALQKIGPPIISFSYFDNTSHSISEGASWLIATEACDFIQKLGHSGLPSAPSFLATDFFISNILSSLHRDLPEYTQYFSNAEEPSYATDGAIISLTKSVGRRIAVLELLLKEKPYRKQAKAFLRPYLRDFCLMLFTLAQLTKDTEEEWINSPNSLLLHEEQREESFSWEVRDVAVDCLSQFLHLFGREGFDVIAELCNPILYTVTQPDTPLDEKSWREREAVLSILSHLLETSSKLLFSFGVQNYFFSLCEIVRTVDLTCNAPVLVTSRALLLLRVVIQRTIIFEKEQQQAQTDHNQTASSMIQPLFGPCVMTLSTDNFLLAVCSCRLLSTLIQYSSKRYLVGVCTTDDGAITLRGLLGLSKKDHCSGDSLFLALETLSRFLKKSYVQLFKSFPQTQLSSSVEEACNSVVGTVFEVWSRRMDDPNIGEVIVDVVRALVCIPVSVPSLISHLWWLKDILQGHGNLTTLCNIPYVITIVSLLFRTREFPDLTAAVETQFLGPLCQLVLNNDDSAVASEAANCLKQLLRKHSSMRRQARTPSSCSDISQVWVFPSSLHVPPLLPGMCEELVPVPLHSVLLAVVRSMLSVDRFEAALLSIGGFLTEVINFFFVSSDSQLTGNQRQNVINEKEAASLLGIIVSRLCSVKMDSAVQELVKSIAFLMVQCDPGYFVYILCHVVEGSHGGEFAQKMFQTWLPKQSSFYDSRAVFLSFSALIRLLEYFCGSATEGAQWGEKIPIEMPIRENNNTSSSSKCSTISLSVAIIVAILRTVLTAKRTGIPMDTPFSSAVQEVDAAPDVSYLLDIDDSVVAVNDWEEPDDDPATISEEEAQDKDANSQQEEMEEKDDEEDEWEEEGNEDEFEENATLRSMAKRCGALIAPRGELVASFFTQKDQQALRRIIG